VQNLETPSINNYDGGSSASPGGNEIFGGNSGFPIGPGQYPTNGATGSFKTEYKNIVNTRDQFKLIEATFQRFNEPVGVKFIKESFDVVYQSQVLDFLDVAEFFHPLQDFSNYQKQTIIINPTTSFNLDSGSFTDTNGEISMLIARAEYLPEAANNDRVLLWDYLGSQRNLMGDFMVLTGAIKKGYNWKGWDIDPFSNYAHNGLANSANGGFIFTNPTSMVVKLTIITAN
jgi:hypothetical protein